MAGQIAIPDHECPAGSHKMPFLFAGGGFEMTQNSGNIGLGTSLRMQQGS